MRNDVDDRFSQFVNFVVTLLVVCGAYGVTLAEERRTGGPTPSTEGAEVHFIDLKDGATVPTKVTIRFGLREMGVAPAGSERANSGHHHLLIDTELPPLDQPIPNDFNHLHFGAGQTEADITLKPGTHTLQLLLGDKDHIPHNPPVMSPRIRIVVMEERTVPKEAASPEHVGARKPRILENAIVPLDESVLIDGLQSRSSMKDKRCTTPWSVEPGGEVSPIRFTAKPGAPGRSAISCPGNRQHAPLKLPDRIRRSLARNKGEGGVPVATIPH